jgi:carbon-monoxide dehydrogenase medium subunit
VVEVSGASDDEAVERALAVLEPADDIHATAAYRTHLARALTRRVLHAATDDARERIAG